MDKFLKIIKNNGLIHASSRKLPLLAASCILFAYTVVLKKKLGYSYKVMGAVGKIDEARFLINEKEVGKSFSKAIKKVGLGLAVKKIKKEFGKNKQRLSYAKKEKNCFNALKASLEVYCDVLYKMGFYNSMMRYVENNESKSRELGGLGIAAAKDKDVAASFIYIDIESLIKRCVTKIGKDLGFNGDLLRYGTLNELKRIIKERKVSKEQLAEFSARRNGYFCLMYNGKEYVTSNKRVISDIRSLLVDFKEKLDFLKGASAYPGKAAGRVRKAFHGIKNIRDIKPGDILVTNLTKPEDTPLLKRFSAIITDEGGILSHIAIAARELKIPSVMSTKIATQILEEGDLVEVDANKGIVRIIK